MSSEMLPSVRIPAAQTYQVPTGPIFDWTFEIQDGMPVDGSNSLARALSPFVIEILPPLVMGNTPDPGAGSQKYGYVSAYGKGLAGAPFERAKNSLAGMPFIGADKLASLEAFVAQGQLFTDASQATGTPTALQMPFLADARAAADIAIQLNKILETPPLTLLINPDSFSIQYTKIQQYTDRSRSGLILQSWGSEQPKLQVSGKIGAFIAGSPPGSSALASHKTSTPSGVQFASKRNSASWQNLMALFSFYANNGYIYDTINKSNAHYFVGALAIHYDQNTYIGNMNSFEFGYDEGSPNGMATFDLDFTVSMMRDNAQPTGVVRPMKSLSDSPISPSQMARAAVPAPEDYNMVGLGRLERLDSRTFQDGTQSVPQVNLNAYPALPSAQSQPQRIVSLSVGNGGFETAQAMSTRTLSRKVVPFTRGEARR